MNSLLHSHQVALQSLQHAIDILATWAGATLPSGCSVAADSDAIVQAKALLSWSEDHKPATLQLLFDQVKLTQGQSTPHYVALQEIANTTPNIPYPTANPPSNEQLLTFQQQVKRVLETLTLDDWHNASLLLLILEKYASCLSLGSPNVAMIDQVRATAAVAAAITDQNQLSLVAGDLSGIQTFIYTISSDGALKSLRARSFYLELVTEEIVQQLLTQLSLPRTSVIYAGGGNLYLLAPATSQTTETVEQVRDQVNQWLLKEFQGKVFLALTCLGFPVQDVANKNIAQHWDRAIKALSIQKSRKFDRQLSDILQPRRSYEPCRVCHRDDVENLQPLNEPGSVEACGTCRMMFQLGGQLPRISAIVRSQHTAITHTSIEIKLASGTVFYNLFHRREDAVQALKDGQLLFLINNWNLADYRTANTVPLLLGNYGQRSQEDNTAFLSAAEMAETSQGIQRVGYLRMDVDRLGQIFAKGLDSYHSLPRLAGLSRQMSYFFKVYLNSLAEHRHDNLPPSIHTLTQQERQNLLFIYAGGDDLFVSGSWNHVVEFSFDVYQSFRAYTGDHPDITLSAGISMAEAKYPLYQAADRAGDAEHLAKGNGRDSLSLFGQVFKWSEWLGMATIANLESDDQTYLKPEPNPALLGVFPFVQWLDRQLQAHLSRSFVRNLLITAQVQDQLLKQAKEKQVDHLAIRYYLHLPKIAYTLARLPKTIRDDPSFEPVRKSLKSPRNAPYFRAIATWLELLHRNS